MNLKENFVARKESEHILYLNRLSVLSSVKFDLMINIDELGI